MKATDPADRIPLAYRLLLLNPRQIRSNLRRMREAGVIETEPTLWQVFMGVLYMWHRIVHRPGTIGETATGEAVRDTRRARWLRHKPLRGPCLLWERAIAPLDFTGFASTPDRIVRHLLGAYHPGDNFFYDLQALSAHPGKLEELRRRTAEVIGGDDRHSRWLKDLTVYDGYHERLLAGVDRALAGDFGLTEENVKNPDTSLTAFIRWCTSQPATPSEAYRAWRQGALSFEPRI